MTTNQKILISRDHHFYPILENAGRADLTVLSHPADVEKLDLDGGIILDLTAWGRQKKSDLLEHLCECTTSPIVSDLTLVWGEAFLKRFPFLAGAIATVFYSPTSTYEAWVRQEHKENLSKIFEGLNLSLHLVEEIGIGFTFPRITSMVINEAYFAKEEGLASNEDLDTAMKFGVNYPLGPLDWATRTGAKHVVTLLDELYTVTGDPRYRASSALRLENPRS